MNAVLRLYEEDFHRAEEQGEDKSMPASTCVVLPILVPAADVPTCQWRASQRRRISSEARHALETLGHAIEHLSDEFGEEGGGFDPNDARLEAVHLLMAINHKVYFECPEAPTFSQRCGLFLQGHLL